MNGSSLPNLFFAVLLFVAHFNCVIEHQLFAQTKAASVQAESNNDVLPVSDEQHDDCHESGCICKGATVADNFVLTTSEFSEFFCFQLVLAPSFLQPMDLEVNSQIDRCEKNLSPSLRAQERCVVLQSFQI